MDAAGTVRTVVGDGRSTRYNDPGPDVYDWTGDGRPAREAQLNGPSGIVIAPDGDVIVSESTTHDKVRRIDAQTGVISTIAGADLPGFDGDGGPAPEARLDSPFGLALAPDGDVFVADALNHRVRRVDAETGMITTVAGTGEKGGSGDGGPAVAARLDTPIGLAVAPDGSLAISEPLGHRVRLVASDGTIHRIAGTGIEGYDADGVPAASTRLNQPRGLAYLEDGSLLVADTFNRMIRRIAPDGVIHRVAGTGEEGRAGDGGPWLDAEFDTPNGIGVDPVTGAIYVADTLNQAVRALWPDGTVRHIAGNGELDLCGDGGPAVGACLRNPQMVAVTSEGDVLITDLSNQRVRVVRDVR